MNQFPRLELAFKALRELGPSQVGLYALYQVGLRTGHYHRTLTSTLKTLNEVNRTANLKIHPCLFALPNQDQLLKLLGVQVDQLYAEVEEIVGGYVRLFGGQSVPLELKIPEQLSDWTSYEAGKIDSHQPDIKFVWEAGRFGWACKLAMAYHLFANEHYAEAFWHYTERFLTSNPPYLGPHWASAQEVAIRLVAIAFSLQVFSHSFHTTPERLELIIKAITFHAERIPPTLAYARSQNNNHLITEALGLYTAAAVLPEHPMAHKWHTLGWHWLIYALRNQISADGTYIQHSTNYHRLMLQAAMWAFAIHDCSFTEEPIPSDISSLLEASTRWLWKMVDPESGCVPNLGHNDGAYILPLTACPYPDYRPVIHAASLAFLQNRLTPSGPWDDMSYWLFAAKDQNLSEVELNSWHRSPLPDGLNTQAPYVLSNPKNGSWATLRVATFHSRPAHADQLHLDLWWRGLNLAQDPGTCLYNSRPPWDNSLTCTCVHNTIIVDEQESMQRVSRFLYLDWAQAKVISYNSNPASGSQSLTAGHDGYRKLGISHSRKVTINPDGSWEIIDLLDGPSDHSHTCRLHWLLPDWEYQILDSSQVTGLSGYEIRIHSPFGWVRLKIGLSSRHDFEPSRPVINLLLARAGKTLFGTGIVHPIMGWTSPIYGDKIPALACIAEVSTVLPIQMKSDWILPGES